MLQSAGFNPTEAQVPAEGGREGCASVGVCFLPMQESLRQLWRVAVAGNTALCLIRECWGSRDVLGKPNPRWMGTFHISCWPCLLGVCPPELWLPSAPRAGDGLGGGFVLQFPAPEIPRDPVGSAGSSVVGRVGLYLMGPFLPKAGMKCVITCSSTAPCLELFLGTSSSHIN